MLLIMVLFNFTFKLKCLGYVRTRVVGFVALQLHYMVHKKACVLPLVKVTVFLNGVWHLNI